MYNNVYYNESFIKARCFIENREFEKSYEFLKTVGDKCAQWYYLTGISAMNMGYYEEAESSISKAKEMDPENQEYNNTSLNFSRYRDDYNDRAHRYNRRRHNDLDGCCCCCCDDCCCCIGDDCCGDCMQLWCLDSCCECCGGDIVSCF
ncbi:MAG: hypothetical protein RSD22_08160 [Romboutsia sp.]